MKKENKNSKRDLVFEILCFVSIAIFLVSLINNSYKFLQLKKNGIIETAVVNSYSLKTWTHVRGKGGGTYNTYHAKLKFHINDENKIHICIMDFKPSKEYVENEKIIILYDYKNNFILPVNEIETYKTNEIILKIIGVVGVLLLFIIIKVLDSLKIKNRNKRIKKLVKKNPELKEKYEKQEKINKILFLIIFGPFLLIFSLIEWAKNGFKCKKKKK